MAIYTLNETTFNYTDTNQRSYETIPRQKLQTPKLTILLSCFDQTYFRFLRTLSCSTLRAFSGCNQYMSTLSFSNYASFIIAHLPQTELGFAHRFGLPCYWVYSMWFDLYACFRFAYV